MHVHAIMGAMDIISVIVEYNPLQAGHAYQLLEAKRRVSHNSAVMVVMSGFFTQRGEPALMDKWSRTRMALASGVDLVLHLKFNYNCASAERFADGGVRILRATGLIGTLVFGSESGDLGQLQSLAERLVPETSDYQAQLRACLDQGLSFPAARQQAIAALWPQDRLSSLLREPNNILAVEYLKAIRRIDSCRLNPLTIQRRGQDYRDDSQSPPGAPPSAAAVRMAIRTRIRQTASPDLAGLLQDLAGSIPDEALAELLTAVQQGPGPLFLEDLAMPILSMLRTRQGDFLDKVPGMGEGLGRRLAAAAARPAAQAEARLATLLADSDTRRFARTRVQRALIALLAGLTADDHQLFDRAGGPSYLRVLGFNRKGRYLLKLMRRLAERPIITRASDFLEHGKDPALCRMAELDLIASDLWHLAAGRPCGIDFDSPVIMS